MKLLAPYQIYFNPTTLPLPPYHYRYQHHYHHHYYHYHHHLRNHHLTTTQLADSGCPRSPVFCCRFSGDLDLCGMRQSSDRSTAKWSQRSGATPSQNTGPLTDVSGRGHYIFLEASGIRDHDYAALVTACPLTPDPRYLSQHVAVAVMTIALMYTIAFLGVFCVPSTFKFMRTKKSYFFIINYIIILFIYI